MSTLTPATELAATNTVRQLNESPEYRAARQDLLAAEIELRRQMEHVAELRRALPPGGEVPADFHFVAEDGSEVTLNDLFGDHDTLVVYSYMFGSERDAPCPMCTSLMSSLSGKIANLRQRIGIAFTARSPIEQITEQKKAQGLDDLPVFSDASGEYTRAYVDPNDGDTPGYSVFTRRDGSIRHFWSDEIGFQMADPGQDPRGAVQPDSLWLVLDTTPGGRGTDWYPSLPG